MTLCVFFVRFHFSSYLSHFPNKVWALFSHKTWKWMKMQWMVHHTKMRMSEKGAQNFNDVVRVFYIHFMCEGPFFLHPKTGVVSRSPYYICKMCKVYSGEMSLNGKKLLIASWRVRFFHPLLCLTDIFLDGKLLLYLRDPNAVVRPKNMLWWKILLRRNF